MPRDEPREIGPIDRWNNPYFCRKDIEALFEIPDDVDTIWVRIAPRQTVGSYEFEMGVGNHVVLTLSDGSTAKLYIPSSAARSVLYDWSRRGIDHMSITYRPGE